MTPKVSVIMPCYNEPEDVFRRSLESVVGQTLCQVAGAVEIIIVLDKPDNTELTTIIWEYQRKFDNIVFLTPEKNLGRGNARNLALSVAQGDYVAIHDADDVDVPERLEEQYTYMEEHLEIWVLFSEVMHVDALGNPKEKPLPLVARQENGVSFFQKRVNHATMFVRNAVMKEVQYRNMQFGEDLDLWIQLYKNNTLFGYLQKIHTHYLAPNYSTHTEYVEKMKWWKLGAMNALIRHSQSFASEPYFYGKFMIALADYIMLHFGKSAYLKYRSGLIFVAQNLRTLRK